MASGNYKNGPLRRQTTKIDQTLSINSGKPQPHNRNSTSLRRGSSASPSSVKDAAGGRVRVSIRLRPRNQEELVADADFADCVELQPELKRLKLRKNNWDSDTYQFDEVLTEFASQKRVYEVVAKPVVESVLEGYNGTVMAYGQTGTGKTFTLGRLGDGDAASRGIMVRSMEDILAEISPETGSVSVSYLQLYMESVQDLLDPCNDNISIVEDPKNGDVSVPGATIVDIKDQKSFLDLLRVGEAHRFAANTKLNTESSRSHAILMVHVKRSAKGRYDQEVAFSIENGNASLALKGMRPSLVRRSKLVVVDLAGSERIDKSGCEGRNLEEAKSINLSLSAMGKCINALAENSSHIPVRDSKLTRLLRDSFGGTARTSLIVTIGPSPRHRGETASTIMFGQRAMKVENMLKLKEEFDYKSMCRRLEIQLEKIIAEHERQQKALENDVERISVEAQNRVAEIENEYADALENEKIKFQKEYFEAVRKIEEQCLNNQQKANDGRTGNKWLETPGSRKGSTSSALEELALVKDMLQNETQLRCAAEEEAKVLKTQLQLKAPEKQILDNNEISILRKMLEDESVQKEKLEVEIAMLKEQLLQLSLEADETRKSLDRDASGKVLASMDNLLAAIRRPHAKEATDGQKSSNSTAKLFEQVGLERIFSLLESENADVRIHAVKIVANLAAEESNQEKIIEVGGLSSLLTLLKSTQDETVRRVAAGAIANLGMNEMYQELIMSHGGIHLLSLTSAEAEDPQTLRMVAGAIANLCGNDKLLTKLRTDGGVRALLGMVRCGHPDVLAQVARGIANFAKCEPRAVNQGSKPGRSLLIEDGALPWIVRNASNEASSIRRHIQLALCHLAQHEANVKDLINGGALWELVRITRDCRKEDIRTLAHRALVSSSIFQTELRRLRIECL